MMVLEARAPWPTWPDGTAWGAPDLLQRGAGPAVPGAGAETGASGPGEVPGLGERGMLLLRERVAELPWSVLRAVAETYTGDSDLAAWAKDVSWSVVDGQVLVVAPGATTLTADAVGMAAPAVVTLGVGEPGGEPEEWAGAEAVRWRLLSDLLLRPQFSDVGFSFDGRRWWVDVAVHEHDLSGSSHAAVCALAEAGVADAALVPAAGTSSPSSPSSAAGAAGGLVAVSGDGFEDVPAMAAAVAVLDGLARSARAAVLEDLDELVAEAVSETLAEALGESLGGGAGVDGVSGRLGEELSVRLARELSARLTVSLTVSLSGAVERGRADVAGSGALIRSTVDSVTAAQRARAIPPLY